MRFSGSAPPTSVVSIDEVGKGGGLGRPSLRSVQIVLGLIWLLDGVLQFQPFMFSKALLTQVITPVSVGQPAGVKSSIVWSVHMMGHHLVLYNAIFATIQVLIGLGLLVRRTVRPALAVSFVWALGVWWFGEGLGQVLTGTASPLTGAPGAVLLYGFIGILVWPVDSGQPRMTHKGRGAESAAPWAPLVGKVLWVGLWILSAVLWLAPANRSAGAIHDQIQSAQYGWLGGAQHAVAVGANGQGAGIAIGLAVLSVCIGLGVFLPGTNRIALAVGALLSLGYWAFGQGFGQFTTGRATDVNAGLLFCLLALRLWIDPPELRRGIPPLLQRHVPASVSSI